MPRDVAKPNIYLAAKLLDSQYNSLPGDFLAVAVGVSDSKIDRWRRLWEKGEDTDFSKNGDYRFGKMIAKKAVRELALYHTEKHQVYLLTREVLRNVRMEYDGKNRDTLRLLSSVLREHFGDDEIDICCETASRWLDGRKPRYFYPELVNNTYLMYEMAALSTELTGKYWKRYCAREYRERGKGPAEIAGIFGVSDQWVIDATRPDRRQPLLQLYYDSSLIQRMIRTPREAEDLATGAAKSGPIQRWINDIEMERFARKKQAHKRFQHPVDVRKRLNRYVGRRAERLGIPMTEYLAEIMVDRSMARAAALGQ